MGTLWQIPPCSKILDSAGRFHRRIDDLSARAGPTHQVLTVLCPTVILRATGSLPSLLPGNPLCICRTSMRSISRPDRTVIHRRPYLSQKRLP